MTSIILLGQLQFLTVHVFVMYSLSNINQHQQNATRISSEVAYWTRKHLVTGSNSGQENFLFYTAAMSLFYIIQSMYITV
jgi:hypothetical protein